jgi:AraC family transcriptional regulator
VILLALHQTPADLVSQCEEMYEELFAGRAVRVGVLRCEPTGGGWRAPEELDAPVVVTFPLTSVVVGDDRNEAVLANPNHAVFFNRTGRYTRRRHDPRGDVSVCVALAPSVVERLTGGSRELPFLHGPCAPSAYLAQHSVVHRLQSRVPLAPDFVEETVLTLVARTVVDGYTLRRLRQSRRAVTRAMHHTLVERAKTMLTEQPAEPWTLESVAQQLHTSEFHLARIFRTATGFGIHQYLNELRLRLALDLLDDAAVKVGELAHRLGYSSHSHFTDAFTAVFGAPPAAVRGALGPRSRREVDRVVLDPLSYRLA